MIRHIISNIIIKSLRLKSSVIINLVGLSLGFTILLTISFYITEELGYNKFHKKLNNIYCIFTQDDKTTNGIGWNESVPALPAEMRHAYPEVSDACLMYNSKVSWLFSNEDKKLYEEVQLAEPNIFNIFSFPIIHGAIPAAQGNNKIIALSKKMSQKYFGDDNPVGKSIKINNKDLFTVVAVFEDIPGNSSIHFNIWAPIRLLEESYGEDHLKTWSNLSFQAYVLLHKNASIESINSRLFNQIQVYNPESKERAQLYPFSKLYLDALGHKKGIRMMALIATIILIIVCLNFINLQSAEAFKNIKNFGIRKINGAGKAYIFKYLIGEALVFVAISIFIALIITHILSEYLLTIIGKTGAVNHIISTISVGVLIIIAFIIAIFSGLIPGLTIDSVSPINSLKEKINEKTSVNKMRYIFTSLQFCMAIGLIICVIVTNKQVAFLRDKNLGFEKEQLVYINLRGGLNEKYEILKTELNSNPNILSSSVASRSPIGIYWNGGGWNWEGKAEGFDPQISFIETDDDFQKTFRMNMKEGSYFKSKIPGVVINNTFAKMIAPNGSALNTLLRNDEYNIEVPVIGIIDDFHFKPLNREIGALMLIPKLGYDKMKYLFIKISPSNLRNTLKFIKTTVMKINPDFPYELHFLDEEFAKLYDGEARLRDQFLFFSFLAILLSCMGLWGVVIHMVRCRTKEIGVRKINGAKTKEILALLNKDYLKWVAIAFIITSPLAWYIMDKWLQNFAYRTEINWWIFALAGLIALVIELVTVSWLSWRVASRNPVEALRHE